MKCDSTFPSCILLYFVWILGEKCHSAEDNDLTYSEEKTETKVKMWLKPVWTACCVTVCVLEGARR